MHPCTRSRCALRLGTRLRRSGSAPAEPSNPGVASHHPSHPPDKRKRATLWAALLRLSGGERGIQLSLLQPLEPLGIHKPEVCPVLCLEHCRAIQVCADSSRAPPCAIRECCLDRRGLAADGSIRWTRLLNEPSQGLLAANHFIANNGHLARGEDLLLVTGGDHASSALAAPGTTHKCRPSSQFAIGDMKNAVGR